MIASSITPPLEEEEGAEVVEWNGLGPLDLWPLRSKLGLASSCSHHINGTHNCEVRRLRKRDRGVANDPRDSIRKNMFITGRCILIDIYKGKYEMRGKVNGKVLDEEQQKVSTRLSNRIIVRQGM